MSDLGSPKLSMG
jgi:hypothetical protein